MRTRGSATTWVVLGAVVLGYGGFMLTLSRMSGERLYARDTVYFARPDGVVRLPVALADEAWDGAGLTSRQGALFLFGSVRDAPLSGRGRVRGASVALIDRLGTVLRVLDVPPCGLERCPVYPAGTAYRGRLEAERGWLQRHGVRAGSRLEALSLRQLSPASGLGAALR